MVEPYSQLQDEETVDLRRMYMKEPKLYPELRRFATFKHGIRKLCLNLDFDSFLHFLKITIAYVHHDTGKPRTTCDVLEELPNLDGIRLILPGPNNAHGPRNLGPIVWHDTHPCPRKLHRMIYVRAAEVFVTFKDFVVENFFDELEEKSFNELRKITDLQARFTKLELNELYEDCKGGIKLDVPAPEVHSPRVSYLESYMTGQAGRAQDDKFPPVCDCDVSCHETFQWVGKYKESAGEASTG
ncbi:hypothetical protein BDV95DRAFT_503202 [Massariosphaeria phaeospora]|uniref:Uncharacterized protein n=1 Tax=Massariosphaeria phaeospora TaxID=100035 RepID=A0A7C8I0C5_9PLEO|nr:hypothetical protein BDV95DRAFT_503202 [Massariosphaeria phaeospora]